MDKKKTLVWIIHKAGMQTHTGFVFSNRLIFLIMRAAYPIKNGS